MLGSNINRESNLKQAQIYLSRFFLVLIESPTIETPAIGNEYQKMPFLNKAVKISSQITEEETRKTLKRIEKQLGRTSESKPNGIIPIDIDLIFWNNTLIDTDYYKYQYIRTCIDEIKD